MKISDLTDADKQLMIAVVCEWRASIATELYQLDRYRDRNPPQYANGRMKYLQCQDSFLKGKLGQLRQSMRAIRDATVQRSNNNSRRGKQRGGRKG